MFARPFARSFALLCDFIALALCTYSSVALAEVTAEKSADKVTIKIDGEPFAEYLTNSGGKPVVWPIIGPTGAEMTRSYPLKKVEGEKTDHVHHRSLWFTHGDINGIDFWAEKTKNSGTTVHREFVQVEGGKQAVIVTRNDWQGPDGKKVLEDERRLAFFRMSQSRVIDFDITLKATEGPVTFGDTKEGSFGIRVPESMRVEAKHGGRIHNSEGQADDVTSIEKARTWGKRASWVDYSGPVKGAAGKEELAGITILNHPSSFRFPTHWHVRTYGLFAANPFGIHDFENKEKNAGNHTLASGQSLALRYRVIFHKGDIDESQIRKAFDAYAASDKQASSIK